MMAFRHRFAAGIDHSRADLDIICPEWNQPPSQENGEGAGVIRVGTNGKHGLGWRNIEAGGDPCVQKFDVKVNQVKKIRDL